jgi:dienelactone hydrolase
MNAPESALVDIDAGSMLLKGDLTVPARAEACVIFAHGSGSSRWSPRNRWVARCLQEAGLATLLFDLLTLEEERKEHPAGHCRFDIPFLSRRLDRTLDWLRAQPGFSGMAAGLFGASTGAAAALATAAQNGWIQAVVSRGGRPDLAGPRLRRVPCPVLLMVGSLDADVVALNEKAARDLPNGRLHLVPGATHLFPEPGALQEVAGLAAAWFLQHLACRSAGRP